MTKPQVLWNATQRLILEMTRELMLRDTGLTVTLQFSVPLLDGTGVCSLIRNGVGPASDLSSAVLGNSPVGLRK